MRAYDVCHAQRYWVDRRRNAIFPPPPATVRALLVRVYAGLDDCAPWLWKLPVGREPGPGDSLRRKNGKMLK